MPTRRAVIGFLADELRQSGQTLGEKGYYTSLIDPELTADLLEVAYEILSVDAESTEWELCVVPVAERGMGISSRIPSLYVCLNSGETVTLIENSLQALWAAVRKRYFD
ncbi:hypothetical protein [Paenibacillus sp. CAA11]|uniref:hypothetical protein n=1 Tax=Paenibacillus sp. CAA11 TaxID=1532905 RepID=UPI00131F118C|nr:hypothetical protein [Paenibacillus sp. CAA11]